MCNARQEASGSNAVSASFMSTCALQTATLSTTYGLAYPLLQQPVPCFFLINKGPMCPSGTQQSAPMGYVTSYLHRLPACLMSCTG